VLSEGKICNVLKQFVALKKEREGEGGQRGSERKGRQGMKVEDTKEMISFQFQWVFTLLLSECLKIHLYRSKVKQQRRLLDTSFSKRRL
jgi:hypothetical protein